MEPTLEKKEKFYNVNFDSVSDMVDTVKKLNPVDSYMTTIPNEARWIGRPFKNLIHACNSIQELWPQGMKTYERIINQLHDENITPPKSLKRRAVWNEDDGTEVSIDRLREGNPYMRHTRREHRPGPVSVTILSSIAASAYQDTDDIIYRGAASICLTELLEKSGYRVELWNVHHARDSYSNKMDALISTCLKRGNDPLDVSTLINVNSGWAFRTVWFGSMFYPDNKLSNGYGFPGALKGMEEYISMDQQIILCEGIWNHSEAVRWIREEISKLK